MRIQVDLSTLGQTKWHDYAVRFLFGGLITALAGIIAKKFGPGIGGLFLAFPAIFPASATLIDHLTQARATTPGNAPGARCPVLVSVEGLTRTLEKIYAARGLAIEVDVSSAHFVRGQREDLEEMLGMTMAQACPPPLAIKCCSEECALTKPPPVRDWDWQSFAILPNFTRGRSRWTTRLWAVCARASGCPPECLA